MMLSRSYFYAKTLVAQVKAYKRFGNDELLYNALDTLEQARKVYIVNFDEGEKVLLMISDYLFGTHLRG